MMLITAASCAFAIRESSTDSPAVNTLLSRCVKFDEERQTMLYNSSTTAYPGLVFFTLLGLPRERCAEDVATHFDKRYGTGTSRESCPGMAADSFFEDNVGRVALFDLFGAYALHLPSMEGGLLADKLVLDAGAPNEGIRFMDRGVRENIRVNYSRRHLNPARAQYVSLLAAATGAGGDFHSRPNSLAYFKEVKQKSFEPLTELGKAYEQAIGFFTLPILFTSRTEVVDLSPDPKPGRGGVLADLLAHLSERQKQ
jgi:hypothetical protein